MIFTVSEMKEQIFLIGHDGLVHLLIAFIMLDIFTGFVKSFKIETTNSTTGLFGVMKHLLVVVVVLIANLYLPLFGFSKVATGMMLYLLLCYLISVSENWVLIGLPFPTYLTKKLAKLKNVMDTGNKITIQSGKDFILDVKNEEELK